MKAMDHNGNGNSWGVAGGLLATLIGYVLKVDWSIFLEDLGTEVIRVFILGAFGGAAGLLSKKAIEYLFFKKKKKG